jgi:hypothetical protein
MKHFSDGLVASQLNFDNPFQEHVVSTAAVLEKIWNNCITGDHY